MRRFSIAPTVTILSLFLLAGSASAGAARGEAPSGVTPVAKKEAEATNTLAAGKRLKAGQSLRSSNERWRLVMKKSGNLVLRGGKGPVWSSQSAGNPGAYAAMQQDGNLIVRGTDETTLFASGTSGAPKSKLIVQGDGKAVVYSPEREALWSTLSDVRQLRAGQLLRAGQSRVSLTGNRRLEMGADGNLVLTDSTTGAVLWTSQTAGNPGAFAAMQSDGNFIVRSAAGATLYATGTQTDPEATIRLLNDGNVVIVSGAGTPLWSAANDVRQLSAGQRLNPGQTRQSLGGNFVLQMRGDGNLVLLDVLTASEVWSTNTSGNPGAFAAMQQDGNFVVRALDGAVLFHTGTVSNPPGNLKVLDDGNLVVFSGAEAPLWNRRDGLL